MRPIADAPNVTMFDGVEVDVIDMAREIVFVTNRVLPIAPLPQNQLSVGVAGYVYTGMKQGTAEMPLDPAPASREVGIIQRKFHDGVQMIRKDHYCIELERALLPSSPKGIAQGENLLDQDARPAVEKRHSEKVRAARKTISAIQNHRLDLSRISLRSSGLRYSTSIITRPCARRDGSGCRAQQLGR
ncbi:hypothetical protein AC629_30545 [Bradyrhizobium sp. NAS80.1]|nr:hypothetical protein AC629_30545 [Bradyrhizobium sp. NAS80.1]